MSDPIDIKALDEYLKGDSDVSQRYRELGRDEVPPDLDRRVLAAARDAVANASTKPSRSWLRWSTPVALAASVVLVVTVVLERGGQDQRVAIPQSAVDTQTPVEASEAEADASVTGSRSPALEPMRQPEIVANTAPVLPPPAAAPAKESRAKELAKAQQDEMEAAAVEAAPAEAAPELFGSAPAPEVPAQALEMRDEAATQVQSAANAAEPSSEIDEIVITGMRRSAGRGAGPRGTVTRALSTSRAAPAAEPQQSDPQAWLEGIRDLRRAGKTADADREWERFRKAFPDIEVADDDIARKKP